MARCSAHRPIAVDGIGRRTPARARPCTAIVGAFVVPRAACAWCGSAASASNGHSRTSTKQERCAGCTCAGTPTLGAPLIQAGGFNLGPAHGWPWSPPRRLQGRLVAEPRGAADADSDAPRAYIAASGHDRIRGPSRIDRSITCRLRRICRLFTCRTSLPLRRVVCTGCARWRCRTL
jgi:hypothetical protein